MNRIIVSTVVIALALITEPLCAQNPNLGFAAAPAQTGREDKSLAPNNPWLVAGAQLGYKVSGNSDFADQFIASTRLAAQWFEFRGQSPQFHLPLIGNLSKLTAETPGDSIGGVISKIVNTAEGLNLGFYPYYEFIDRAGDTPSQAQLTLFGSAGWKLNAGKDREDSTHVYLNQGRFSMGLGLDLYIMRNNTMPLSLSVEPVLTLVDGDAFRRTTGSSESKIHSLELTGVLPLGNDFGLLGQLTAIDGARSLWRVGVVYVPAAESGNSIQGSQTVTPVTQPAKTGTPAVRVIGRVVDSSGSPVPDDVAVWIHAWVGAVIVGDKCTSENEPLAATARTKNGAYSQDLTFPGSVPVNVCVEVSVGSGDVRQTDVKTTQAGLVSRPEDLQALNFGEIRQAPIPLETATPRP